MTDYTDYVWAGSRENVRSAILQLGWNPSENEQFSLGWIAPQNFEPTPKPDYVHGFVPSSTVDVSGNVMWVVLIRTSQPIVKPDNLSDAPAWASSALVGRIAEIGVLPKLSRRQLIIGLASQGLITPQEALAAAQTGAVPAAVEAIFSSLPEDQRLFAKITWASMSQAERDNGLVNLMARANNISDNQLDAFWWSWSQI